MKIKNTQIEIARLVGVRQSYISDLLNRKKRPSPDIAERLEYVTGIHRLFWLYPGQFSEKGEKINCIINNISHKKINNYQ